MFAPLRAIRAMTCLADVGGSTLPSRCCLGGLKRARWLPPYDPSHRGPSGAERRPEPREPPCWSRRPARARPRSCLGPAGRAVGPGARSSCWSPAAWPPGPPPRAWPRTWAKRRRDGRLPRAPAVQGLGQDADRGGHRGRLHPDDSRRSGPGRRRGGDVRRVPRAQPGRRPRPGPGPRRQSVLRDDLRLLVMSATLDGARISALLGDAPIVESQGGCSRSTPAIWAATTVNVWRSASVRAVERPWPRRAAACWSSCRAKARSAAPRAGCERCAGPTSTSRRSTARWNPRNRTAPSAPRRAGRRKVVLATSIAETSLTIEGVRVVIDCGLARVPRYDPPAA
jgi:hypothetical protein